MKSLLPLMMALFFLSACSWNPNGEYHSQSEDQDGTRLMTKDKDNSFYKRDLRTDRDLRDREYVTNQHNSERAENFVDLSENRMTAGMMWTRHGKSLTPIRA